MTVGSTNATAWALVLAGFPTGSKTLSVKVLVLV